MTKETALKIRKQLKAKKPRFTRQEFHKNPRLRECWRKPKGLHSKMRRGLRGKKSLVTTGWGSPAEAKGLHKSGLEPVVISTVSALESIGKDQGAIIGRTVGRKKRMEIVRKGIEKKIRILNIKNSAEWLAKTEDEIKREKESKTAKKKPKKEEKKAEKKAKPEPLAKEGKKPEEDEKKKKEEAKKEKDKLLTKRT